MHNVHESATSESMINPNRAFHLAQTLGLTRSHFVSCQLTGNRLLLVIA